MSVLGPEAATRPELDGARADMLADLHLDHLIQFLGHGRDEYALDQLYTHPLGSVEGVVFRQDVAKDLQVPGVRDAVTEFSAAMRRVRRELARAADRGYLVQQQRRVLEGALVYVRATDRFSASLSRAPLRSAGMQQFRTMLRDLVAAPGFVELSTDAEGVAEALAGVRFRMTIAAGTVRITPTRDELDFTEEITAIFARFRREATESYLRDVTPEGGVNHVQAGIVDQVARLYPEPFAALSRFVAHHSDFIDPAVAHFDREVQFYLAYLEVVAGLEAHGLAFCYPTMLPARGDSYAYDTFDPVLALKLVDEGLPVVGNDFTLSGPERVLVVTGPNQSGKTTFARCFGQLHHLAALGLPIPGSSAQLVLSDAVFTHFERGENLGDLTGKLYDDLVRAHAMVVNATPNSVVVFNELFTSTTLDDAIDLATEVLREVVAVGCAGVFVTFIDELADLGPSTVSVVTMVDPEDWSRRTFRVERRPPEGLAYSQALAERHHLGSHTLRRRLGLEGPR